MNNALSQAKSNEPPPEKKQEKVNKESTSKATKIATVETKKRRAESNLPGSKKFKSSLEPVRPSTSFKDIGGNEKVLKEVTQLLVHMRHPEVSAKQT